MKDYHKNTEIGRIRMSKNDLVEIEAYLRSNINHEIEEIDSLSISTSVTGLSVTEETIEMFLSHKELPSKLNQISISMNAHSKLNFRERKSMYIRLGKFNSLEVNGFDQAWVLGMDRLFHDYLLTKRTWTAVISSSVLVFIESVIVALLSVILFASISLYPKLDIASKFLSILSFIVLIILRYSLSKIKNTTIVIRENESFWDKHGNVITIIIAGLSLLATVIIGVLQLIND